MFGQHRQALGCGADTNSMLLIALHVQNGKANLLLICYNCAHTSLFFLQLLLLLPLPLPLLLSFSFMYVRVDLAEAVLVFLANLLPQPTHRKKTFRT